MNVMRQSWHDVTFLHWRYDPAVVRPLVPRALDLDLYDGAAWVGLVPFYIAGLTLPHAPPLPYISNFPETNVRTYARDRTGRNGVWFFSLDAARLLAVLGARAGYALPYFWSKMRVTRAGRTVRYTSRRLHALHAASDIEISIGDPIVDATDLDLFLTMRFRLYAERLGRIWKADIAHPPWPLHKASVAKLNETLVEAAGLPKPEAAPIVHYAPRVDVTVGPPLPLKIVGRSGTPRAA
jgi:uncharacterized protein YqjF (DUF2071 family)